MPYICKYCHAVFDTPKEIDNSFEHAFGVEHQTGYCCPECECPYIEEAVPCGNSRDNLNYMSQGDTICHECRAALLSRVKNFVNTLTSEEVAQLDEWTEGFSIADCEIYGKEI